jgi:hypothetical protein
MNKWIVSLGCLFLAACTSQSPLDAQRGLDQRAFLAQQRAALDSLPLPSGVPPATWRELKGALAAAIDAQLAGTSKAPSTAPITEAARLQLQYEVDSATFIWRYVNPGDYDQNGEVNISDLTPLAVHLNKAVPDGPRGGDSIEAVVDGDGNGFVTIADITPLGASLGRRITQFNLYASADLTAYPDSNGAASEIPAFDSVLMSAALGQSNVERLHFAYPGVTLLADNYYWLRPADTATSTEGTGSTFIAAGNLTFPKASLVATPFIGQAPLNVALDASASSGALEYFFDPEGDGSYFSTGQASSFGHIYQEPGNYNATVRMLAFNGMISTSSVVINAGGAPQWHHSTLPNVDFADIPIGVALQEQDGRPHVFMTSGRSGGANYDLAYQAATGPVGNAWSSGRQIMGSSELGRLTTASVGTRVGMAYGWADRLFYRRSIDPDLLEGWEPHVDTINAAEMPESFSLKFMNGLVNMAYHDPASDNFYFQRSTSTLGDTWGMEQTPVVGNTQGGGVSLAEIGGRPALAYFDRGGFGALEYVRAQNEQGTLWSAPVQISLGSYTMFDTLLTLADGAPGIVTHDYTDSELRFFRAASVAGNWNGSAVLAQTDGNQQTVPRAMMVGDIPHAFWINQANGRLMHSAALDEDALAWSPPSAVSTGVNADVLPGPAEIGGLPAVAFAANDGSIRFAIYY